MHLALHGFWKLDGADTADVIRHLRMNRIMVGKDI